MAQLFLNVRIDWLGKRRYFIGLSILLLLAGMGTAVYRHKFHPHGTEAFNLGVDFKGGTVVTARFKQPPSVETLRAAIDKAGIHDAVIQQVVSVPGEFLIRVAEQSPDSAATESQVGVDPARAKVKQALSTFGAEAEPTKTLVEDPKAAYKIEWTDGAAAVIAVFHTVLVTLGLFSIFQIEINLTVIAALLTLVGFDVNDSIVIFDRIRENRKLYRRMNLYNVTNLSINQTLSRTVITSGLVFLSVVAMVLLGGETLRPFSLALF